MIIANKAIILNSIVSVTEELWKEAVLEPLRLGGHIVAPALWLHTPKRSQKQQDKAIEH